MRTREPDLSPHSKKVLETLQKSAKPMTAYVLLEKLSKFGIKAPPTVYRALETLVERGLVHRIETLGAFVACNNHEEDHGKQFAVCRQCGDVAELHDHRICAAIAEIAKRLKFTVEREMIEISGLCKACSKMQEA